MATKAKTVKAAPVLKSESPNASEVTSEYITVRGKLATYVISVNFQGQNFMAYIKDHNGQEYDVDTDMTAY